MSFSYCHLNIHANLLKPWSFPLKTFCKADQIMKEDLLIPHLTYQKLLIYSYSNTSQQEHYLQYNKC